MRQAKIISLFFLAMLFLLLTGSETAYADEFYVVTYDWNCGSEDDTFNTQVKYPGVDLKLDENVPSRDLYNFAGWGLTSDATTAAYLPGGIYKKNMSITLYAIWEPFISVGEITAPATISRPAALWAGDVWFGFSVSESGYYHFYTNNRYKSGGASSSTGIYRYREDEWGYAYVDSVTRDGDLSGDEIELLCYLKAGQQYDLIIYSVEEKKLALKIEKVKNVVSYDKNIGSTGHIINLQIKEPGKAMIIPDEVPERGGYNFLGWSTNPSAAAPDYVPGDAYTEDAPLALYAVWEGSIDLGTLSGNELIEHAAPVANQNIWFGFTVAESGNYYFYTTNQQKAYCSSTETGIYILDTWGEGDFYWDQIGYDHWSDPDEIDISVNLTAGTQYYLSLFCCPELPLSIHFFKPDMKICYDLNNGIQNSTYYATQTVLPGRELTIYPHIPRRDFYAFLGWSNSPDAATAQYLPGGPFATNESVILYAVWEPAINLGEITGPVTIRHNTPPCTGDLWFRFTVSANGYYHFYTRNNHKRHGSSSTTGISTYTFDEYGYWYKEELCHDNDMTGTEVDLLAYLNIDQEYYLEIFSTEYNDLVMQCIPQKSSLPVVSKIQIPSGTTVIEKDTFANCRFDSVLIPENVLKIQAGAFTECVNLKEITIKSKTTVIVPGAFTGLPENAEIIAPLDSLAYQYAKEKHINFRRLE